MVNFSLVFGAAFLLNVAVTFRSSGLYKKWAKGSSLTAESEPEDAALEEKWKVLIRKYLCVYLLSTLSDWFQGPYVYALYSAYKYSQHDIAVLFVAGFGSSMIFGSFIGGMADWGGRRNFVLLFSVVYAASCLTKHFQNYHVLMLGRLLGGVATSLLFSVFDAWLIRSHNDAGLKNYLGRSFSWAAYGNSIIAIIAGLVSNKATSAIPFKEFVPGVYIGGYLNPFDMALCALMVAGFFAWTTWEENYGEESSEDQRGGWHAGLRNAFTTTIRSTDILLCGIISSLFEGSMYVFVFMWTPALTGGNDDSLPFGLIFSTFMISCMAGSSTFSIFCDHFRGEMLAVFTFAIAALAMSLVALSKSGTMKFVAMNLFEMTVGLYWPIMGTLKGTIVPESMRAAIYNLYRIPLNFIVLTSLLTDLTPKQSFALNAVMLSVATCLQVVLMKRRENFGLTSQEGGKSSDGDETVATKDDNV